MKIKKLGHCCMVIEPQEGLRIMTDPGAPDYSGLPVNEQGISAVLITHEHSDHLHIDSLKTILQNNPSAIVITNTSVGKLLDAEGIKYNLVEEGQNFEISGTEIKGFGSLHAEIYEKFGQVQNTGYMVDKFCYPGDSFNYPDADVEILAFPVMGPWMRMKDAIDYVKKINPRIAFPVHDAPIKDFAKFIYTIPEHFLGEAGIEFKKLELGKEEDL
jgi:L-ascorbate metabolism protein UlaG (beta-lactamase superfamily)